MVLDRLEAFIRCFKGVVAPTTVFKVVLILSLMCGASFHAQTSNGTVAGVVIDPKGNAVQGATVVLKNATTGEVLAAATNEAGSFRISDLKPGEYSATTTAPGFKKNEASNVLVTVSQTTALSVQLEVGQAAETVTVNAADVQLQTESSDFGTSVGPKFVDDLPISVGSGEMRSIINFTFLVPGVVGGENINKLAGGQATGSTILVDSGSIDTVTGNNFDAASFTPSVDAVQEFTILEAGYPAQYGRTTGGVVSFGTLPGGNQYHGKVYDIFHNTALNANSWWNNLEASVNPSDASLFKRPVDMKNEYGLTLGGPVRVPRLYDGRSRTFFFYSWEQYRQNFGSTPVSTVPTVANRNGDFSATLTNTVVGTNPCNGEPIYYGEIFDPETTQQVGDVYCRLPFSYSGQLNHIDPARFSTVAQNILKYMPQPQNSALTQNYAYPNSYPINITNQTIRIDQSFSAKDRLFGSYNTHSFAQLHQGQVIPGPASPPIVLNQTTNLHDAHFGYDHSFSESTLNRAVLSIFRFTNFPQSPAVTEGVDWSQQLGLGNNLAGKLFPTFSWGENYIGLGSWLSYQDFQNHFQVADNVLHAIGRHTLNIGVDLRYQEFTRNFQLFESGNYGFARNETAGTNQFTTESGNGFASFLLGQVSGANASVEAVVPQRRQEYAAVYIQDDFKALTNLTLNLGIRYDVDLPFSELHGNVNNWDPNLPDTNLGIEGGLVFSGSGPSRSGLSSRLADTYYKDIGPRVGFAWAPKFWNGTTVIRGNYGIIYGPFPMTFAINGQPGFSNNPNFTDSLTSGGFTAPFALDGGFPAFTHGVNTDPFQLDNTGGNPYYTARSYGRPAGIQNYGLEIQHELPHAFVMNLAYTGNRGTHLSSNLACPNCLSSRYFGLGPQLSESFTSTQTTVGGFNSPYAGYTGPLAQALLPFPQVGAVVTVFENIGQSSYNAMYAKMQRNFTGGFSLLGSYTWSKTLTDADTTLIGQLAGGFQDPFNLKGEKAVSALDFTNVFVVSYIYELPFGKGKMFLSKGGVTNAVVGGWEIGGIHKAQSGSPASFGCATGIPGNDNRCFRFSLNPEVPIYSAAKLSGHFSPLTDVYFNPQAFVDPNSNARISAGGGYQYGTLRRNVNFIRFPVSPDSDFSFIKRTPLGEYVNTEFRAELFNAFNQHRLGAPNQSPYSPAFGQITGTQNGARIGQLTLRITF